MSNELKDEVAFMDRLKVQHKTIIMTAVSGILILVSFVLMVMSYFSLGSLLEMAESGADILKLEGQIGSIRTWVIIAVLMLALMQVYSMVAVKIVKHSNVIPLQEIADITMKWADGDFNLHIPGTQRGDEIGDIARAMVKMQKASRLFRDMQEEAKQKAEKELDLLSKLEDQREEARVEQLSTLKQITEKFERSVADVAIGVADASSQLQMTASSMASAAEEASNQTSTVSTTLGEASSGVTAAAAASDEFAMSIGEISRQASTSAELARKATEAASQADTTISALSDSAVQVGQIVELISTIAQRTNLLALNASIEAARGGEAGRGFAVVASEVKELATQTGKATDEVSAQIRTIQETTTASVEALRGVVLQIQELESTSISIAAAVDQQSVAGQDLARSIDLAARSTEEVSNSVNQVRETSLAAGTAASQVLSSSTELERQASTLKTAIEEFKTVTDQVLKDKERSEAERSKAA